MTTGGLRRRTSRSADPAAERQDAEGHDQPGYDLAAPVRCDGSGMLEGGPTIVGCLRCLAISSDANKSCGGSNRCRPDSMSEPDGRGTIPGRFSSRARLRTRCRADQSSLRNGDADIFTCAAARRARFPRHLPMPKSLASSCASPSGNVGIQAGRWLRRGRRAYLAGTCYTTFKRSRRSVFRLTDCSARLSG